MPIQQRKKSNDEIFAAKRTGSIGMPNPDQLVRNLALSAVEILEGYRPLDQIAAWITCSVAAELSVRRTLTVQRKAIAQDSRYIAHTVGSTVITSPEDGVIEAVVVVHSKVKSKAVAVRLESLDNRWRSTELSVL